MKKNAHDWWHNTPPKTKLSKEEKDAISKRLRKIWNKCRVDAIIEDVLFNEYKPSEKEIKLVMDSLQNKNIEKHLKQQKLDK